MYLGPSLVTDVHIISTAHYALPSYLLAHSALCSTAQCLGATNVLSPASAVPCPRSDSWRFALKSTGTEKKGNWYRGIDLRFSFQKAVTFHIMKFFSLQ